MASWGVQAVLGCAGSDGVGYVSKQASLTRLCRHAASVTAIEEKWTTVTVMLTLLLH